jgi:hypothetical protein
VDFDHGRTAAIVERLVKTRNDDFDLLEALPLTDAVDDNANFLRD